MDQEIECAFAQGYSSRCFVVCREMLSSFAKIPVRKAAKMGGLYFCRASAARL